MMPLLLYFTLLCSLHLCYSSTPVVMWHGMGDSCCSDGSLGKIIKAIEDEIPGVYVKSLKFGSNVLEDIESGYFGNANDLVDSACREIAATEELRDGYNAIGFSQGGQFLRAIAQRCPNPAMKNLISLGGQHQGVYGLPRCGEPEPTWCDYVRKLLNYGAYIGWIQSSLVQAQYWHDPLNEEEYKNSSIFIADINNEKAVKNDSYADNLRQLEHFVLVKFSNDSMVVPRDSSWFGFYAPGQSDQILSYKDTELYKQDLIGLRDLDINNRLQLLETEGDHLQFTLDWFLENIVRPYLL